jgi:hypothetical protein
LPYHIGNGILGGLTPLIATSVALVTGNMYAGLSWPIAIAALTFIIGMKYLKETKDVKIWDELNKDAPHDGTYGEVAKKGETS